MRRTPAQFISAISAEAHKTGQPVRATLAKRLHYLGHPLERGTTGDIWFANTKPKLLFVPDGEYRHPVLQTKAVLLTPIKALKLLQVTAINHYLP